MGNKQKQYRQNLLSMPKRLLELPVQNGYPVPWFVAKVGDSYDFRCVDSRKFAIAIKKQQCWICGQKLGSYLAFGVGSMCAVNRTVPEPPSHRDCMEWSIKSCPFLCQSQEYRRETNLPEGVSEPAGFAIKRNPGVIALWVTRSYRLFGDGNGGVLFKIGAPTEVHWFRKGRLATRTECLESIESGYPELLKLAEQEGALAVEGLQKLKDEAIKLLLS